MYEMTSEEAKKVIEDFYSEATPEELLKIVVEAGLLEKGYREMIDWRRVLKTDDIFKKHPMDMTPEEIDEVIERYFRTLSFEALIDKMLKAGFGIDDLKREVKQQYLTIRDGAVLAKNKLGFWTRMKLKLLTPYYFIVGKIEKWYYKRKDDRMRMKCGFSFYDTFAMDRVLASRIASWLRYFMEHDYILHRKEDENGNIVFYQEEPDEFHEALEEIALAFERYANLDSYNLSKEEYKTKTRKLLKTMAKLFDYNIYTNLYR